MAGSIRAAALVSLMALMLAVGGGPAEAQKTEVSKSISTPTGEMRVREGDYFTVTVEAASVGSRFWAVLDRVPSGFQIEDAEFSAAGVLRTAFEFDETTVVFAAESANINQSSKVTIRYRVLANVGGTYIIFGAIGYIYDVFEGYIPVTRSKPIKPFQVVSQTQLELGDAIRRLDALEARLSQALGENTEAVRRLQSGLETLSNELTAVRSRLMTLENQTNLRLVELESSLGALGASQRRMADALMGSLDALRAEMDILRGQLGEARTTLSKLVVALGLAASLFAALAAAGIWLRHPKPHRQVPPG